MFTNSNFRPQKHITSFVLCSGRVRIGSGIEVLVSNMNVQCVPLVWRVPGLRPRGPHVQSVCCCESVEKVGSLSACRCQSNAITHIVERQDGPTPLEINSYGLAVALGCLVATL